MKKIDSIEIQGRLFPIDHDAYSEIEKYLQSIRKHFSRYDSAEIITDIESRIAEKFATEILTPTHKTITQKDVRKIIEQMGDVSDMEENSEVEEEQKQAEPVAETSAHRIKKRLFRNTDDAVLGGVASGIAAYFNIDPLFVRLFFLLTFWIGGYNVLLYLILWLLTPEAKTPAEKLQMRGDSITLSSLEKTLKDELSHVPSRAEKVRDSVASSISPLGQTVRSLLKIIVRLAGLGIVFGAVTGLVVLFFGLIVVFFNLASPYVDPAIYEVAQLIEGPWLPTLFSSLYMAVALPLIFATLFGVSLLRLRSVMRLWLILPIFVLWLFSLGTLFIFAMKFAPALESKVQEIEVRRESELRSAEVEKNFELADFSEVSVKSIGRVMLHTGPYQVKAVGNAKRIDALSITKNGDTLVIGEPRNSNEFDTNDRCWIGCERGEAVVHIWAPEFRSITASDVARVESDGQITSTEAVTIELSDASRLKLNLTAPSLTLRQSGVSRSEVTGKITEAKLELNDNARGELADAEMVSVTAITRAVARLKLPELQTLDITTHDNSAVDYSGTPANLQEELHDISRINDRQRDLSVEVNFETE